ncbi:MAG: hypothetical protein ACN4GM_02860 [Gammaproteobacteria bacterium]
MSNRILIYVTLLFTLVLTSCSNTKFTSVWMEKDIKIEPIDNVLVIGIGKNQIARRMFEDRFVAELEKEGINAMAIYKHIPHDANISRDSIAKIARDKNIDAVIMTHLVAVDEETVYNPPVTHVSPNAYYGRYYNYYPTVNSYVQSPGYYSVNTLVKLETSVYDTKTAALVWSAQSSTFNPDTVEDVINPVIKLVIKDLKERQLLSQAQPATDAKTTRGGY